jgi:hypothetical protein
MGASIGVGVPPIGDASRMIPPKSNPKWIPLVKGDAKAKFQVFSGNMMLMQCARKLQRDASKEALSQCIDEAHEFFTKYEKLFEAELAKFF